MRPRSAPRPALRSLASTAGALALVWACGPDSAEQASVRSATVPPPAPAEVLVPQPAESRLTELTDLVRQQVEEHQGLARNQLERTGGDPRSQGLILGRLGSTYLAYGLQGAADAALRRAVDLAPEDPRWAYYLGQSLRNQNRPDESLAQFQAAVRLAPEEASFLVRLGEVLLAQGRSPEAEEVFRRAVEAESATASAWAALGEIAAADGRLEEAVEHYKKALEVQPRADALYYPLALAYRNLGRQEEADRALERRGSEDPRLADPLMTRLWALRDGLRDQLAAAQEHLADGNLDAAVQALQGAVEMDPVFSEPRRILAQVLLQRGKAGDRDAALETLRTAVEESPQASDARLMLAYQLQVEGDLEAASNHYRQVLEQKPDHLGARLNLGNALQALGRHDEAVREYARVTAQQPGRRAAWLREATSLTAAGRCPEARLEVERGLAALPRDAVLSHALARLMAACPEAGARDGARALDLAVALFQARPTAGHAEAVALAGAELGRFEEAAQWQRRALDLTGEPPLEEALKRNLARFEQGLPGRVPWSVDTLGLFEFEAPEASDS